MATTLDTRGVVRESNVRHQGRPIIVRLEEGGKLLRLRQKGLRRWHTIGIERVFWSAVQLTAALAKAEKRRLREERRKERAG